MGDYKLIEFFEDNRLELYDLKNDIEENSNLALTDEYSELTVKMHNMLLKWREDVQAILPAVNPDYKA